MNELRAVSVTELAPPTTALTTPILPYTPFNWYANKQEKPFLLDLMMFKQPADHSQ